MVECNSHETNLNAVPLNDQQQFRLDKINEIKDYFVAENKERELMSKRLSKCIAAFGYFDKSLIVLSIKTDCISIASFATVSGAPAVIAIVRGTGTILVSKKGSIMSYIIGKLTYQGGRKIMLTRL